MADVEDQEKWITYRGLYRRFVKGKLENKQIEEMIQLGEIIKPKLGQYILSASGKILNARGKKGVVYPIPALLGYQIHHLIPEECEAHPVWAKAKMHIHEAENLIHLPEKAAGHLIDNDKISVHEGAHKKKLVDEKLKDLSRILELGERENWGDDPVPYRAALLKLMKNERELCLQIRDRLNTSHVSEHERMTCFKQKYHQGLLSFVVGISVGLGNVGGAGLVSQYNSVTPHPLLEHGISNLVYGRRRQREGINRPDLPFKAAFMQVAPKPKPSAFGPSLNPSVNIPMHNLTPKPQVTLNPKPNRVHPVSIKPSITPSPAPIPGRHQINQERPKTASPQINPGLQQPRITPKNIITPRPSTPIPRVPTLTQIPRPIPRPGTPSLTHRMEAPKPKPIQRAAPIANTSPPGQNLFVPIYQEHVTRYQPLNVSNSAWKVTAYSASKTNSAPTSTYREQPYNKPMNSAPTARPQSAPVKSQTNTGSGANRKQKVPRTAQTAQASARFVARAQQLRTQQAQGQQLRAQQAQQAQAQARVQAERARQQQERTKQEQMRQQQEQLRQARQAQERQRQEQTRLERQSQQQMQRQEIQRQRQEQMRQAQERQRQEQRIIRQEQLRQLQVQERARQEQMRQQQLRAQQQAAASRAAAPRRVGK